MPATWWVGFWDDLEDEELEALEFHAIDVVSLLLDTDRTVDITFQEGGEDVSAEVV